jgi:hypothetical protein
MPVNDKARLTFEEANNLLRYEPETGLIYWRVSKGATKAGNIAGKNGSSPYVRIDGDSYSMDFLAWLLHYGRFPDDRIYHINKEKTDNRIDNLRECSNDEYYKFSNLERHQGLTEKKCTACGVIKPIDSFGRKKIERALISSACKDCEKAKRDAYRSSADWREKHKRQQKERNKKWIESGQSKIYKRSLVYIAKGIDKSEAMKLALAGPQPQWHSIQSWKKHPDDFPYHDDVVKQNALQAWRYWFTEKASKEWLDGYYARQPWKDHRISASDAFTLRYRHDPEFCIQQRMRAHLRRQRRKDKIGDIMRSALKTNGKSNAVERLLGYTVTELRLHLERQFTKRMNWKRFADGDIHIDHIIPISSFDFENVGDPEWKACWALTNLRPLWAKDNLAKSGKIVSLL